MLTQTQIDNIECCVLSSVNDVANYSKGGRLTDDMLYSTGLKWYQTKVLRSYIPPGTLISEGFTSTAILDMSTITTFGVLIGAIMVDGIVIGVLPETTYADLQEVIDAVVAAINGGVYGYQATDNGDNTITLEAPGSGTEANGFIVTIQINPTFALVKNIPDTPRAYNQMIYIDAPTSFFDGYTVIASSATTGIGPAPISNTLIAFKGSATTTANYITVTLPTNNQGYACSYDPVNDQIYVAGFGGTRRIGVVKPGFTYSAADDIIIPFTPGNPNPTDTLGFNRAQFNPFNQCTYFTMPTNSGLYYQSRSVFKLASDGTQTQIIVQVDYKSSDLRINPANGQVWVISSTTSTVRSVKILNPTTNAVVNTIAPANYYPTAIAYYEGDGTGGSERMLIAFAPIAPSVDFRIASYLLDGTLSAANFYVATGLVTNIFYSALFNNIFITDVNDLKVLRIDGTLKQTFVSGAQSSSGFVDDPNYNFLINTGTVFATPNNGAVKFYTLTDDGSETADGALEGGTPDVFQTEADNCISSTDFNNLVAYLKRECGCNDCGTSTNNGSTVPPSPPVYTVYYGRSALTTLTNTQVEALTGITSVTYAGSYPYSAAVGQYCYFAYPASLGTPTRFKDLIGGLDMVMNTVFQVTINSVIYNVYRSYNTLSAAQNMEVIA